MLCAQFLKTKTKLGLQENETLNYITCGPSTLKDPLVSISSCQWNLMKTYHNEANTTSGITKIASKNFLEFFEQSS